MAGQLSLKNVNLPEDWNDDIRMNFLFAVFREKSVNPEGYDAKMNFWFNFVQELCLKSEAPVINLSSLCFALDRKGSLPQCLEIVLENMYNKGLITSFSEFSKIEPDKGWIGWGFDVLVQKPVSWGFSTVQGLLKWAKKDEHFVVISVIKQLAKKVLLRHKELVNSEITDNVVFLDTFEVQCKDICMGTNFDLAIIQLQKEKQVYVFEDKGRKVLKFAQKDEKIAKPLTELDKGILNLQNAKDTVLEDIDTLESDIQSCTEEIKHLLKTGSKTKAMLSLKKKKRLEVVLKKKSVAFDNIESLLIQLQNSDSEKMVLAAYKVGAQAIKATVKDDLNLDDIDNTMAEVEGAIDDYSEVQNTLAKPVSPGHESLDEFEDELNELLAANIPTASKKKEPSYTKIADDDLLRRLSALRAPPEGVPPIKKPAMNKLTV